MYIYIYVYMYIYMYIYIYVYIHIYMYICIYICKSLAFQMTLHCVKIKEQVCIYICIYICIYVYIYIYTYIYRAVLFNTQFHTRGSHSHPVASPRSGCPFPVSRFFPSAQPLWGPVHRFTVSPRPVFSSLVFLKSARPVSQCTCLCRSGFLSWYLPDM
jgi:hypothetical protein